MATAGLDEALKHHGAGRLAEAEALYRDILAHYPDDADSLHLLGLSTVQRGDAAAGAALILRAMALAPGCAPHHNSLALAWRRLCRAEDAVAEYRVAVALRPNSAEIHNNLAATLCELGRYDDAIAHYRLAAERAPDWAEVRQNLANAYGGFGRWLMLQGRWAEAEARLAEAARLGSGSPQVVNNLGVTLAELGRVPEAEGWYRRAIALDPGFADAHFNLGCLLHGRGDTGGALACHAAALAADPGHGAARIALCMAQLPIVYRSEAEVADRRRRYAAALEQLVADGDGVAGAIGSSQPFFLPYQGEDDFLLQATYGKFVCRVLGGGAPLATRAGERIRVGIVSGFFCDHTVFKLFLESWLTRLDRRRFEVIGFHTGSIEDAETARAAGWCDRFVHRLPAEGWREAVTEVAPHVLLYPEIGMDPIAARLAAQRLAPVQCVAWGQPVTTGMPTVDYFLSSALMEPADGEAHYTERLVRLPNLGLCYLADDAPAPADRAVLGLDADATVFWSGQALYKYLPRYDAVFPRIAAQLEKSQFVFIGFAKSAEVTAMFRERLWGAFADAGLDAGRHCVILPPMSRERFVAAVGAADVVLDTPGWSGGKSTLDCLAADPAIVTLPGRFMRGRHTAAILRRIGCEATIAGSLDEYVEIAVRLGRDAGWRAEQRRKVAEGKGRAFADMEYVRALERFLVDAVAAA